MQSLDAGLIRGLLSQVADARLGELEVFAEVESTNSHLMQAAGPAPGKAHVAVTDNQTAGRGRRGRYWHSPPGSGLCLSISYGFATQPANLPALTLAIGLSVIETLGQLGINGVSLKWPNDLVAMDGKLGGILTEAKTQSSDAVAVVTGLGLNVDLSAHPNLAMATDWARSVVDLKSCATTLPDLNALTASLSSGICDTFVSYEQDGFAPFHSRWRDHDWLLGRAVTADTAAGPVAGFAAGVADDGALLVDTRNDGRHRVTSGSVMPVSVGDGVS